MGCSSAACKHLINLGRIQNSTRLFARRTNCYWQRKITSNKRGFSSYFAIFITCIFSSIWVGSCCVQYRVFRIFGICNLLVHCIIKTQPKLCKCDEGVYIQYYTYPNVLCISVSMYSVYWRDRLIVENTAPGSDSNDPCLVSNIEIFEPRTLADYFWAI